MTSKAPGSCCISGVMHDGESIGEFKDIAGTETYLSYPPDKKTEYGIVYICDAFGMQFVNNRLLADSMAHAGYFVVMPDIFHGDPVPTDAFSPGATFDFQKWLPKHPKEQIDSIVDAAIKAMRSEFGVKKIGAVGYCFGGKYVVRFLAEGKGLDAGFIAHPSLVVREELKAIRGPLSIAAAEIDHVMSPENRHESEEILLKLGVPYQLTLYGAVEHGFAVRTDLSDKRKKFAMESAYFQAIRWFDEWLKN
ncbi:alpha/beta-hydrolase [Rhizodiscina lignyota]|uniref:Alpha/beta-hydrolase n=1 Tax=Rhizodiscina lignyota TaxID=1504668 RepID=A0A9P4IM45_9PEZI|nr:alpha/beta-hydrolase [Rhizodiscina lignyota]